MDKHLEHGGFSKETERMISNSPSKSTLISEGLGLQRSRLTRILAKVSSFWEAVMSSSLMGEPMELAMKNRMLEL